MRSKPSIPRSASSGLTLIELLVAAAIGILLIGIAFSLVMSNRRVYNLDQARTAVNQNLRAALDLIGADIRQAGEHLPQDFPVIEIKNGTQTDELILRKGLLDAVLPVCADLATTATSIQVNRQGSNPHPNPACYRIDGDGNGWDDRLEAWRTYRCAQDGTSGCQGNADEQVKAYIYDPVDGTGEFFDYIGEDLAQSSLQKSTQALQYAYSASHSPRLYLLEEHRYRLTNDVLELIKNGGSAQKLVDRILSFEVKAEMQDGSQKQSFGTNDDWTQIAAVIVEIKGQESYDRGKQVTRNITARYLPRNVLSH